MLNSETTYVLDALDSKEMFYDPNVLYMIFLLGNLLKL